MEGVGYTATKHQRDVGAGYFDQVLMAVTGSEANTTALTAPGRDSTHPSMRAWNLPTLDVRVDEHYLDGRGFGYAGPPGVVGWKSVQ
jgi:hypothetical protein